MGSDSAAAAASIAARIGDTAAAGHGDSFISLFTVFVLFTPAFWRK